MIKLFVVEGKEGFAGKTRKKKSSRQTLDKLPDSDDSSWAAGSLTKKHQLGEKQWTLEI